MDDRRELERLRTLLFERELRTLDRLRSQLDALDSFSDRQRRAECVSDIIAEALAIRGRRDEKLNSALEPVVDDIVKNALRTKLPEFTDALFPLMGPSIRKSIAEAFRGMLQSFSKSMEIAFSLRGLRWRLEALRTGRPFSEVVLLHTLVYRVEQVFFIHSATGISLAHVTGEGVTSQDADMVSAMLTAIQDFVQDCLASGKKGELESLQHGDHTIMVEKQASAYLACIVRGTPPSQFREQLRTCLEDLSVIYFSELAAFKGDIAPFEASRPYLEALLEVRYQDDKAISPKGKFILGLLGALLLGLLGYYGVGAYKYYALKREAREALALLSREPGLLISYNAPKDNGTWEALIFRDQFAAAPEDVLKDNGLNPAFFEFETVPYVSYQPEMVSRRLKADLKPPSTVELALGADGILVLSGTAPVNWILEARRRADLMPGILGVDSTGLYDPRMRELAAMAREVESAVVEFPSGQDVPAQQYQAGLNQAVNKLVEMEQLAAGMDLSVTLTIYGHADATGTEKRNYEVSQARARTIAAMLYAKGSSLPVLTYGLGSGYAGKASGADQASRRIEMRVQVFRNGEMLRE
jgi:OOP family OmpA-OmpF porin